MAEGGGDGVARGRTNMVFWDIEKCPIPDFCKASDIFSKIKRKLSVWGFRGPVKMRTVHVNNYATISPETSKELSDSGIIVDHIKFGVEYDFPSYPIVLDQLIDWIQESPVPANVLFISANRELFAAYSVLREDKHNILRIRPELMDSERDDDDYCSWSWSDIFRRGGRPLTASVCYYDEWTWSETCHKVTADCLASRSGGNGWTKLNALRPRRTRRSLSNGGTTLRALYLRRDMKLLRNGCLCPWNYLESQRNGGEPSGSGGNGGTAFRAEPASVLGAT